MISTDLSYAITKIVVETCFISTLKILMLCTLPLNNFLQTLFKGYDCHLFNTSPQGEYIILTIGLNNWFSM